MSYEVYKFLHIAAVLLFFMLSVAAFYNPSKMKSAVLGIVGVLILVFGFGLMARLGIIREMPMWIIGKIVVWLIIMGGAHMIAKRSRRPAMIGIPFLLILALLALYFVIYKPGTLPPVPAFQ